MLVYGHVALILGRQYQTVQTRAQSLNTYLYVRILQLDVLVHDRKCKDNHIRIEIRHDENRHDPALAAERECMCLAAGRRVLSHARCGGRRRRVRAFAR